MSQAIFIDICSQTDKSNVNQQFISVIEPITKKLNTNCFIPYTNHQIHNARLPYPKNIISIQHSIDSFISFFLKVLA